MLSVGARSRSFTRSPVHSPYRSRRRRLAESTADIWIPPERAEATETLPDRFRHTGFLIRESRVAGLYCRSARGGIIHASHALGPARAVTSLTLTRNAEVSILIIIKSNNICTWVCANRDFVTGLDYRMLLVLSTGDLSLIHDAYGYILIQNDSKSHKQSVVRKSLVWWSFLDYREHSRHTYFDSFYLNSDVYFIKVDFHLCLSLDIY